MLFQTSIKLLFIVKHQKNYVLNDVRPHSLSMYEIKGVNIPSVPELCLDQHDGEYALKKSVGLMSTQHRVKKTNATRWVIV